MVKKSKVWVHPKGYHYVRKNGKYYRINAKEGTQAYDAAYWAILNGRQAPSSKTMSLLIKSYRQSERWVNLAPRTRKDYSRVHLYLEEKIGKLDVTSIKRVDIITAMNSNKHRIRFANYIQQTLNVLLEHAIDIGWLNAENPARGIKQLKTPKEKQKPHLVWPDWAVAKFRKEATPEARLIFEIGIGSVQRPDDWTRFTWADFDGSGLRVKQQKTDKKLYIPCTHFLLEALKLAPKKGLTIIGNAKGQPLNYRSMSWVMLNERKRLGLEAYDLHALRYRGVQELASSGCSDDEIASYSGHSSKAMIEKYAGEARQHIRALQANKKRQ